MERSATVQVALPLPIEREFTYSVPPGMVGRIGVGYRVLVPFGHRSHTGVVVGVDEAPAEVDRLKAIIEVLDDRPAFTDTLLRLTRWMADYYVCAWGEVLRAALPSGIGVQEELTVRRTAMPAGEIAVDGPAAEALRRLEVDGPHMFSELRGSISGLTRPMIDRLEAAGLVEIRSSVGHAQVRVKKEKFVRRTARAREAGTMGARQRVLMDALSEGETVSWRVLQARAGASASTLASLVRKEWVEVVEREAIRTPFGDRMEELTPSERPLHAAQVAALSRIGEAIDDARFETFLLHGVTGSGKTEVYIAALKRVLEKGKTGIILVPEIALTPQTVGRFCTHFGDRIAVLHSRMSTGERYDAWRHLRGGRFDVVIGARSAILAPVDNVGLIVVDEEHEGSYKQADPAPRYHARDVAVMRARMSGAVCVLGSATPSFESYVNAREAGKYTLLSMPNRVPVPGLAAAELPEIRIVDLAKERKKHRLVGVLSMPLREAISERLSRREQVILLQNRRGYAPVVECLACGWSPVCTDCSVTLTWHKAQRHLRCHYCGRTARAPRACGACGSTELHYLGAGTQRVEEELAAYFPSARVLRMDLDTTSRKQAHHQILDRFGRGLADILVGTQMVAKGLDFGRVTLVGVVDADTGMRLPDFRAEERTFQLLTQVAGRAGRADLRGEVILQTRMPDHAVLRFACGHDVDGFVRALLPGRLVLGYPPYGTVVCVEFRGPDEGEVARLAGRWAESIEAPAGMGVLSPQPALIGKVKNQYRFHVVIKAQRRLAGGELQQALRQASASAGPLPAGYRMAVDVDAVTLF